MYVVSFQADDSRIRNSFSNATIDYDRAFGLSIVDPREADSSSRTSGMSENLISRDEKNAQTFALQTKW